MQKTRSDTRFGWQGWFGRPMAKPSRQAELLPDHRVALPKSAKAKVRATPKAGKKNPMQSLAELRYTDISRAFRQAPWRVQIQVIASLAAGAIVLVALGGLYLTEASRAATAGRDVQALQAEKAALQFAIDRQTALIADAKAVARLEQRARDLGFRPADIAEIDFILVQGYYGPQHGLPVEAPPAEAPALPSYNETLGTWFAGVLTSVIGSGG